MWEFTVDVTLEDFAYYIGQNLDTADEREVSYLEGVLAATLAVVQGVLSNCDPTRKPDDAEYKQIVLEVADEWRKRKDQGASQDVTYTGTVAVRAPKDPLSTVRPLLKRYVGRGIG